MSLNTYVLEKPNINHYLFASLIIMNVFDFITTYMGIVLFGATEQNPIMATAIAYVGTVWVVLFIKALVLGHVYYHYYHTEKGLALWARARTTYLLVLFNIMFLYVFVNNINVMISKI